MVLGALSLFGPALRDDAALFCVMISLCILSSDRRTSGT